MYRFLHGSHLHIPPGVDKNEENMRQILFIDMEDLLMGSQANTICHG